MKAIHGNTKSERKNHRKFLHERDVSYVSIYFNFIGIIF